MTLSDKGLTVFFFFLTLKRVESFLHKDVSFVVTGSQDGLKDQKGTDTKAGAKGTSEEAQRPIMQRESILSSDKRRPGTPRPVVRSIALKCFKNSLQGLRNSIKYS